MTRYYLDTEFLDDGHTIELISIGVVCEDGREFYAENLQVPWHRSNPWVDEHVRPHLRGGDVATDHRSIGVDLRAFVIHPRPEFWSWCSAYDWITVCQLYGSMVDKPEGWPNYCRDLQQELDHLGLTDDRLPPHPGTAHNALADAHWHQDIHRWLLAWTLPLVAPPGDVDA